MNYAEAKIKREELWDAVTTTSKALQKFPVGAFGLTPDDVKKSPEFIAAKNAYKLAAARQQAFGAFFNKHFKVEHDAERREKRLWPRY